MFSFLHAPFSAILVPFILGIIITQFIGFSWLVIALLLVFGVGCYLVLYLQKQAGIAAHFRWIPLALLAIIFLCLGAWSHYLTQHSISKRTTATFHSSEFHFAKVQDYPKKGRNLYSVPVELLVKSERHSVDAIAYFDTLHGSLSPGEFIRLNGDISLITTIKNPEAFDYASYMRRKGVTHQIRVESYQVTELSQKSVMHIASQWRMRFIEIFGRYLHGDELAIASALVLGYKADLSPEIKSAYAGAGAMHVLAVSGLHVGLVYYFLSIVLGFLNKTRRKLVVKYVIIIGVIMMYAALTGFSPSVTRAAIMFSLFAGAQILRRNSSIYNIIFVSAFGMLLYDTNLLFDVSFQLSYIAVIGIIYLFPLFFSLYEPKTKFMIYIWGLVCLSVAAQLSTFPIALYYFKIFPTWFLLTNLIVVPAATIILPGGFLLLLFHFFGLGLCIGWPYGAVIKLTNILMYSIDQIPPGPMDWSINFNQLMLIYLALFLMSMLLLFPRKTVLFSSYVVAVLLTASFTLELYNCNKDIGFTVFSDKYLVMEFHSGTESVVIADSIFLQDETKKGYLLSGYNATRRIDIQQEFEMDENFENSFIKKAVNNIRFYSKSISLLDGGNSTNGDAEILIIKKLPKHWKEKINWRVPEQIVILKSLPFWQERELIDELETQGIPFWSIRKHGAFVSQ